VLLNIMNLTVDEADNLASALVKLSVSQTSTDQAILTATERFGSLGTAMGFTAAQLLAIGSAGTALGQEPEAVGGSIQRIFSIILRALAEGNEAIDEFSDKPKKLAKVLANMDVGKMAEIAGVGAQAFIEEWEAAPQLALERFLAGFGALTPQQQSLLFGKGGIFPSFVRGQQTLQNLSASQELLKEGSASASAEFERGQFIYEQSALRFDTLKQSLQLLASSVVRAGVAFGDAFDEELGGAIKRITQYITDNEAVFAEWGRKVGAAIKAIDWQQVKQFAADFFGVFKTGVQATVAILDAMGPKLVAFLAIWKTIDALSGGAVTKTLGLLGSGAGGVIKLVWDQFKARGSSPANPLWVQMIGGGLGAGGGVGLLGKVGQAGLVAAIGVVVGTALAGNPTLDGRVPTGGSRAEQFARMARLRAGLDEPPAPPGGPAGFGEKYGPSLSQLGAVVRAGDLQEETNAILNRGFDTTAGGLQGIIDRLPRLKPIHRAGERGKSIQSAEFKALMGLDPSSPTYAAELTKYVADLVEHYKKEPIGSGRHPKGFILPALNRTEKSLAADLKTALASGNTALATTIAERLRDIGGIKGNDLPAGIQKLVNSTLNADAKRETEANRMAEKTGGVKSAVGSVGDRVENLTAALRRKRLSVTVRPTSLQIKQVIPVRNNLSVRISGREVSRSGNTTTSYGPNIVFQIPGAYYGGGGGP
jgi:TP901 family phage tail tape measure protein